MEQRSPEWFAARAGKVTASRVADVMAKIKSGESASRKNYKADIICERLTGTPTEGFTTKAMQDGIDREPIARAEYESRFSLFVDEIAIIDHPTIPMAAASPDGMVGSDGLIEIKCPNKATHLEYFMDGVVPSKYIPQMNWQLACTGRKWVDFVSYNPDFPDWMQLFVIRHHRNDEDIQIMESEVMAFLKEVDQIIEKLRSKHERSL